ncbi:MAG: GGDEF domain-containing protein [Gaiellaceae bacterium]
MGPAAAALELALVLAAAAGTAVLVWHSEVGDDPWTAFGALLPLVLLSHLLGAERARHQGSQLSLAPMFAAVLVLPPGLAALAIGLAFVPEWVRTRADWYIALFNVANFVGPAMAARAVFDAVGKESLPAWSLGASAALAAFLLLQYGALALMLRLARGVRLRDTVRPDCVLVDAGLLSLGAAGAALWDRSPVLVVLTLLPLALAYRSLAIPALVEATRIEPKTGLYNLRHLRAILEQELNRAARFDRWVAILMVDVDHLREINTRHGHLAGDRALRTVADALRRATRDYDVAARFGGDEFCVLLPETDLEGALVVAERVRALVELETRAADVPVTVSLGTAAHRGRGTTPDELIALADRAAYRAKFSGRNAVAVPPEGDAVGEAERALLEALGR